MAIAMTPKRAAAIKAREESALKRAARIKVREESVKRAALRKASGLTATGKMLRSQRELLELSQKSVAKYLGFSNVFLSRIEFGKCYLPIKYVDKAAKILRLEKSDILFYLKQDLNSRLDKRANR